MEMRDPLLSPSGGGGVINVGTTSRHPVTVGPGLAGKPSLTLHTAIFLALGTACAQSPDKPGWKVLWSDEFTDAAINTSKWSFEVGPVNVNSELEYYSNAAKNAFVENGSLVLRAVKENVGGRNYTSAKMTTRMKGDWLYGRIEVRAKLNSGKGIWPAIWMMPTDNAYGGWPSSGEMDIMELLGHQPAKVYGTVHWNSGGHQQQGSSKNLATGTFADDYHVFGYEWESGHQRWYIDDELYFSTAKGQPFDKRFYLILNVAVGGGWPGNPDATTPFPNDMSVDYVRVYQKSGTPNLDPVRAQAGFRLGSTTFTDEAVLTNGGFATEVVIRDLSGRILARKSMAAHEKSGMGGTLPQGVYVIEAISRSGSFSARLCKTR
jgi:beta-glucanase (GH16 family)